MASDPFHSKGVQEHMVLRSNLHNTTSYLFRKKELWPSSHYVTLTWFRTPCRDVIVTAKEIESDHLEIFPPLPATILTQQAPHSIDPQLPLWSQRWGSSCKDSLPSMDVDHPLRSSERNLIGAAPCCRAPDCAANLTVPPLNFYDILMQAINSFL